MVAGQFRKRGGRLLAADAEGLQARLEKSGKRILSDFHAASRTSSRFSQADGERQKVPSSLEN